MFTHNMCHVMLSRKASYHHYASKIMFRHEGHMKQRDLFVGNVIIFIIAFKALPFLILLSLHCLLSLCSTTATIFLLFPCVLTLQLAFTFYTSFDITYSSLLLPFQALHYCCFEYFCFIHCCSKAFFNFRIFGVICFCFFIQAQHHHHFEDFAPLTTIPRLFLFFGIFFVFCLQLISSRFCLLLFLQYIFVKCRFGQQPFMNNCLK